MSPTDPRRRVSLWKSVAFAVCPALIALTVLSASLVVSWWLGWGVARQRIGPVPAAEAYLAYRCRQAMAWEASGRLDEAAKEYEAVRAATSPGLKGAADAGLRRVAAKVSSPGFAALVSAEAILATLRTVAIGAILLLVLLVVLRLWPRRGWMLGEFEVPGSADSPLALELRSAVADTVTAVQLTYRAPDAAQRLLRERLDVPGLALPGGSLSAVTSALSGLGDLKVMGVGFSLDKLARAAGDWLPQQRHVIGGRLAEFDGGWSASATMERLPDHEIVETWVARESEIAGMEPTADAPDAELPAWLVSTAEAFAAERPQVDESASADADEKVRQGRRRAWALGKLLAYKLLFHELARLGRLPTSQSLAEFYLFSEALRAASSYAREFDTAALAHAIRCLERLVETSNTQNALARYNLGTLYLSRGDAADAVRTFRDLDEQLAGTATPQLVRLVGAVEQHVTGDPLLEESRLLAYLKTTHPEELNEAWLSLKGGILQQAVDRLEDVGDWLRLKNAEVRAGDEQAVDGLIHFLKKLATCEQIEEVSTFFEGMGEGRESVRAFARALAEPESAAGHAWSTLQSKFSRKRLEQAFRTLDFFYDDLWFLVKNKKRREQTIIVDAGRAVVDGAKALGEVRAGIQPGILDGMLTALQKRLDAQEWTEALKAAKVVRSLTKPADLAEARSIIEELLKTTTYRVSRRSGDPYSDELGEVRKILRANAGLRLRCLYNLALANFQTFESDGCYRAVLSSFQVRQALQTGKDVLMPGIDRAELSALADCLEYQALFRIHTEAEAIMPWLFDGDAARKFAIRNARAEAAKKFSDDSFLNSCLFNFELNVRPKVYAYRASASVDVKIAAHETLGLWARYRHEKEPAQPDESADHFATALAIQPRANTYAYLAESVYDRKSPDEARKLLRLALKLSPRHALAHRLQDLMA